MQISATHRYGYYPGEWFNVVGVGFIYGKPQYKVEIKDGSLDLWPVYDLADPYKFRSSE